MVRARFAHRSIRIFGGALTAFALVLASQQLAASANENPVAGRSQDDPSSLQAQSSAQASLQAKLAAEHPDAVTAALATATPSAQTAPAPVAPRSLQAEAQPTFDASNIINDSLFYVGNAASASQVQDFLNLKGAGCTAGALCLKNYTQTTTTLPASPMCAQYVGAANETAATIIARVGQLCGISQEVLLTVIQKESGLVAATNPEAGDYETATGYGCSDTAENCDKFYYGFYNQVYSAAEAFKRYSNPHGTNLYFTYYPVGTPSTIYYNPDKDCGSSSVTIQNAATAALYYYTPYQPNAAALENLYGDGDSCSTYGNRNFFTIYLAWFQNPVAAPDQFFTDVPTNATFYPNIQWMARLGLTTGTPAPNNTTVYLPADAVTRQAMAAFLYRYNGAAFTPPATPSFSDVSSANPFYTAIEWMKSAGISTGNADGTFKPEDAVTRQDMAAFLARYSGDALTKPAHPSFTDVPASSVFYTQVEWMKAHGISTGNADGTYAPLDPVTRQAMAAFLQRLYTYQSAE
jgi:hypothetical protein